MKKEMLSFPVKPEQVEVFQHLLILIEDYLSHPDLTADERDEYYVGIQELMEEFHQEVS